MAAQSLKNIAAIHKHDVLSLFYFISTVPASVRTIGSRKSGPARRHATSCDRHELGIAIAGV
jgi:hypothetical protein